jgi:amino acid permease
MNKQWYATATIMGTIVGAGILGIPYVIAKSGFFVGLVHIILISLFMMILSLYLGEIILRTHGRHQLTGYAEKYLGKWGKRLMMFSMIFGIYGALIAYLIGEGEALSAIFGGQPLFYTIIFFIAASSFIYIGVKSVSKSELFLSFIKIAILISLCALLIPSVKIENLMPVSSNLFNLLYPFGVILFAFSGIPAIVEAREVLAKNENLFKKSIIYAYTIPIIIYIIFTLVVVGTTGAGTTELATAGLSLISKKILIFANIFAVLTLATPFMTLGLALQEMYEYDYKLKRQLAFALSCVIPFVFFLAGIKSFVGVMGIAGALGPGLAAILIVLMFWKAKKKSERIPEYTIKKNVWLGLLLMLVFLLGAAYEIYIALF